MTARCKSICCGTLWTTTPGTAILLVGDPDGGGFRRDIGFRSDIARMLRRGWGVELLSWERGCGKKMKEWARENGIFIPLDQFYEGVTYLTPTAPGPSRQ